MKKFLLSAFAVLSAVMLYADSQTEIFNRTTKYLDKGGILFQFYNTENMEQQLESFLLLGAENSTACSLPLGINIFKQFSKYLELNALQGVGISVKDLFPVIAPLKISPLYQNKSFIAVEPKSSGSIFAVARDGNIKFTAAKNLPDNTIFAIGVNLNMLNVYSNIERSAANSDMLKNISASFELNFDVRLNDFMKNISGEYFFAVYKDKGSENFHFLVCMPDKNAILEKLVKQRMAPLMKVYKDKSASLQMPMQPGRFGNAFTVYFAQNRVFIYNSNAPLADLLNSKQQKKLLVTANLEIFSFLLNCEGNSYAVLNLDTAIIDKSVARRQYQFGSVGTMTPDGYLQNGKSNYNIFNFSEYLPIVEIIKNLKVNEEASPLNAPLQ